MDIRAERLELDQRTGRLRFSGEVVATQGELELRCAWLEASYDEAGGVSDLRAGGGIRLRQGSLRAEAAEALYSRSAGSLELKGQPRVQRGADQLEGERVTFWPGEGRLLVTKARGRLQAPSLEDLAPPPSPLPPGAP